MNTHILVVDDDRSVRFVVSKYLSRRGYTTARVGTAEEAFAVLDQGSVHVVVLDITLEDEDGLAMLGEIKRRFVDVAVIIHTGKGYDEELWQRARSLGADGYLSKALPMTQLVMELRRVLKNSKRGDSASAEEAA